jgi:hypothetical protein
MDESVADWTVPLRRLRWLALWVLVLCVGGVIVTGAVVGHYDRRALLTWSAVAVVGWLLAALVLLLGHAFGAMLRVGERGERLGSDDVGLLPRRPPRP